MLAQPTDLGRVGSDHRDVGGRQAGLDELADFFQHQAPFGWIAPAGAVGLQFFVVVGPGRVDERHRLVGQRRRGHARQVRSRCAATASSACSESP